MPQSLFSPSFQRSAPVFTEAELRDPAIYEKLISQIRTHLGKINLIQADSLLNPKEPISIGGMISLDPSISTPFLTFLTSFQKEPTFFFVSQEKYEQALTLLKQTKGENWIVVIPYQREGKHFSYQIKTQANQLSFLPHYSLIQFFISIKDSCQMDLSFSLYDSFDKEESWKQLGLGEIHKQNTLVPLTLFPGLPDLAKQSLLQSHDPEILKNFATRKDLTDEQIIFFLEKGERGLVEHLILHQKEAFASKPFLAKKGVARLFEHEDSALKFLIQWTSSKNKAADSDWLFNEISEYYADQNILDKEELKRLKKMVLQHPLIPIWAKGIILEKIFQYRALKKISSSVYLDKIISLAEKSNFWEWYCDHSIIASDPYSLWLHLILIAPDQPQLLESKFLSKLNCHHRLDALQQYVLFLEKQYLADWKTLSLVKKEGEIERLIQIVNHVITSNIPERKEIFSVLSKISTPLVDRQIDPTSLLQVEFIANENTQVLDQFQKLFSYRYMKHSRQLKSDLANELFLAKSPVQKEAVLKLLSLALEKGDKKELSKKFVKSLQLLNTLYQLLENVDEEDFSLSADNYIRIHLLSKSFEDLNECYNALIEALSGFLKEELQEEKSFRQVDTLLRIRLVLDYLKYKSKWKEVHPEGVVNLKILLNKYLEKGADIKDQKYGRDPLFTEAATQMNVYRAVLEQNIRRRFEKMPLSAEELELQVQKMAQAYIRNWQSDLYEKIIPFEENGRSKEPRIVWTTDSLQDWLTLGKEGAFCCLRSDNDSLINRALLGRLLSGVCKMKYIGSEQGDRSTRIHESLNFAPAKEGAIVVLNDEQIFTTVKQTEKPQLFADTVTTAVLSALRNAGRYGAQALLIPDTPGYSGLYEAFLQHEEKIKKPFFIVVDHYDEWGNPIAREKIEIASIEKNKEGFHVVGLKERNPWRNWVGHVAVNGRSVRGAKTDIVEQSVATKMEIAGVPCEGIGLDFPGIKIELKREIKIWSSEKELYLKKNIPEKVHVLYGEDPSIAQDLIALKTRGLDVSQFLNSIQQASRKVIDFMERMGEETELKLVVAIPRGGLPVALTLKEKWRNSLTGYLHAQNGHIVSQYLPPLPAEKRKTVFLVDEVIVSGKSVINSIHELKAHGIKEEEIVVLALGAKLKGIETILRKFPALKKMVIGVVEETTCEDAFGIVSGLIPREEKSPRWIKNSFDLFLAEDLINTAI